jgi:hypothetical protein
MKLQRVVAAIAAVAVLVVAACSAGDVPKSAGPRGDGGTAVVRVVLAGGIACDTMDGDGKAISCDWQGPKHSVITDHPKGDGGTRVSLLTLRNGVHCAVMDGGGNVENSGGKAIDCNWDGRRSTPTNVDPKGDSGTTVSVVTSNNRTCAVMDGPGKAISCERTHLKK